MNCRLGVAFAATILLGLMSGAQAQAGVLLSYSGNSTNKTISGASARATFRFEDLTPLSSKKQKLSVTIENTSDPEEVEEAWLTGLAFDIPEYPTIVFDEATFTAETELGHFLSGDVKLSPFGKFDVAFSDDNNLLGGSPDGSLGIGNSVTLAVEYSYDPEKAYVMAGTYEGYFFEGYADATLSSAVRFQGIETDTLNDGSDKIHSGEPTQVQDPSEDPIVPEPASIAIFGIAALGIAGAGNRRRRNPRQ